MSVLRRYEILLPSQFNDGRPIPQELIAATLHELEQKFGAVSCETQAILGLWRREGELYRDSLARVVVDAEDTPQNREFFVQFKQRFKKRFPTPATNPSDDRNRSAGKCCRSLRTDDAKRSSLQNRAGHWAITSGWGLN